MALIVRGETKTISKEEMKKLVEDLEKNPDGLEDLSPEKREIRKEIQDAKRHREFMGRVAKNEARDLENVIATSEIVTIAVGETVSTTEEPTDLPEVDLHDIFIRDRKGFIVGKKGKIFSFQL
mgnify:CR=1 FL=1